MIQVIRDQLMHSGWLDILRPTLNELKDRGFFDWLESEYKRKNIYPQQENIFKAFNLCHYDDTKIVIVGQDPYYTAGKATGLAFGVAEGSARPRSLENIFKEVSINIKETIPPLPRTLEGWAKQGVLLMNSVLTVEENTPNSHANKGWEDLTAQVIRSLSLDTSKVRVFMLWGEEAKSLKKHIENPRNHIILEASHPSPLSCRGFFGCRHFAIANEKLLQYNQKPIDWIKIDSLKEYSYGELIREKFI